MRPLIIAIFFSRLLFAPCFAQQGDTAVEPPSDLYVYGTVRTYEERDSLPGALINLEILGEELQVAPVLANNRGRWSFDLDRGHRYRLHFSSPGRVAKRGLIDATGMPDSLWTGGWAMNVEMTLFKDNPDVDYSVLNEDIGRAKFNPGSMKIEWDLDYTEGIRKKLEALKAAYDASPKLR